MSYAPAILDIEASGFGTGSYPIEVGYVLPNGQAKGYLIRPASHWTHWDPNAEKVHGIPQTELLRHGKSPLFVATELNLALAGMTVYSDAWSHDYTWLAVLYDEAGMVPSFRLEHLARLMSDATADSWNRTRAVVEAELQTPRHRASTDARVLQATWLRLQGPRRG